MMTLAFNTLGDAERIAALSSGTIVKTKGRRMTVAGDVLSPTELELQAATLARDWDAMFSKNGVPYKWPRNAPLGKYSFFDTPGGRVYVPFTGAEIASFGNTKHAIIQKKYKCPPKRRREMVKRRTKNAEQGARKYPPSDPRHAWALMPGRIFCRDKHDKTLAKVAVLAAVVTASIMFGPQMLALAKTVGGKAVVAGGKLASAAKAAAPMAVKVLNGKKTVQAIQAGQMPGPPISLGDGSLTDYAQLVGEQMLERDLARQVTDMEKQQLAYLIEQQRLAMAKSERPHLPVVNSGLAPELTAAQKTRADEAVGTNNLLKFLAIGVPVGLLLWKGA